MQFTNYNTSQRISGKPQKQCKPLQYITANNCISANHCKPQTSTNHKLQHITANIKETANHYKPQTNAKDASQRITKNLQITANHKPPQITNYNTSQRITINPQITQQRINNQLCTFFIFFFKLFLTAPFFIVPFFFSFFFAFLFLFLFCFFPRGKDFYNSKIR